MFGFKHKEESYPYLSVKRYEFCALFQNLNQEELRGRGICKYGGNEKCIKNLVGTPEETSWET